MADSAQHVGAQFDVAPADPHSRQGDTVTGPARDCHELLAELRAIAAARTIPLAEIAPLHTEVAKLAGRARLLDPDFQARQAAGRAVAKAHRPPGATVG